MFGPTSNECGILNVREVLHESNNKKVIESVIRASDADYVSKITRRFRVHKAYRHDIIANDRAGTEP